MIQLASEDIAPLVDKLAKQQRINGELLATLRSIVDRYSELQGRDATHHEFACCIYSAADAIARIEGGAR